MKLFPVLICLCFASMFTVTESQINEEDGTYVDEDDDLEEIAIEEVVEDTVKQQILVDRNYNSSFTISVPMLTVTVPGSSGVVRFSMSHVTLWALVATAFVGLTYPIFLGPHGRLHKRDLGGRGVDPSFLDHLESLVDVRQIYEDVGALVPHGARERCWRRALCEAHEHQDNFGLVGTVMRNFYSRESVNPSRENSGACAEIFGDCAISPAEAYEEALKALFSNANDP